MRDDGGFADIALIARTALTGADHWQRLFEALRRRLPELDRLCAAMRLDRYTAYLPLVAQPPELDPILGREGLYADREDSKAFEVIAGGLPALVREDEWARYADLQAYGVVMRSNLKVPVSFGGHPTVVNLWSRTAGAFAAGHEAGRLADALAEVGRSPFRFEPAPVGLALRRARELAESRARALAA
jgi:hypothetical protein